MSSALFARASALSLLPAGAVAGFGVGALALAVLLPQAVVAPLPPITALAPLTATPDAAAAPHPDWAPLFGTPTPPAMPEPQRAADPVPDPGFDDSAYRLQGLVVDEDDGYALLETDDGVVLVRPGDRLDNGATIDAVTPEGVELSYDGESYLLTFQEDTGSVDAGVFDGDAFDTGADDPDAGYGDDDPESRTIPSRPQRGGAPSPLIPANEANEALLRNRFGISR